MEVVAEVQDFRVPNQLIPRGSKKKEKDADKDSMLWKNLGQINRKQKE